MIIKAFLRVFLLTHLVLVIPVNAQERERVLWDKQPIVVMLAVGQERLIHFETDIRYWVPETVQDAVTLLAANGVLYIQSTMPFRKTRIRVQDKTTGRLFLLDIISEETGNYSKELVVTPIVETERQAKPSTTKPPNTDWPVRLIRFAAQSLYAPERLSPSDKQIRRVAVDSKPLPLLRGGDTESTPLGQWAGGGWYVTAVLVRNLSNRIIEIAPVSDSNASPVVGDRRTLSLDRDVRGQWWYSSAHHTVLHPAGDDADRTCLYLVSRLPFAGAQP